MKLYLLNAIYLALRLQQLGHKNWLIVERENYAGGLATTFVDAKGFHWDAGGHVIFSHYSYFDDVVDKALAAFVKCNKINNNKNDDEILWLQHKRNALIRYDTQSWIPYPFQANFYRANNAALTKECFEGLYLATTNKQSSNVVTNFEDLVEKHYGSGIVRHFMRPYNLKVWAFPLDQLSHVWIGERLARVDFSKTLNDFIDYKSSASESESNCCGWGPNATFRYPKYGGTGGIWRGASLLLDQSKLKLNTRVVEVDAEAKRIKLDSMNSLEYDFLINTMPIDHFMRHVIRNGGGAEQEQEELKHSQVHIVGLGFEGTRLPADLADKSWIYFPDPKRSPFYRMTILSNHSPFMTGINSSSNSSEEKRWSLLFEMSESSYLRRSRADGTSIVDDIIDGALNEKLIDEREDLDHICSRFHRQLDYGYPTPCLNRDIYLKKMEAKLRMAHSIFMRGRFGGWK